MNELQQVEIQIKVAKEMQTLRDNCILLQNSPAFKDVVEEGYFKEEATRLVMLKSASLNEATEAKIDKMIVGIGSFHQYLALIMQRGAEMDASIAEHEETRETLLAEEVAK